MLPSFSCHFDKTKEAMNRADSGTSSEGINRPSSDRDRDQDQGSETVPIPTPRPLSNNNLSLDARLRIANGMGYTEAQIEQIKDDYYIEKMKTHIVELAQEQNSVVTPDYVEDDEDDEGSFDQCESDSSDSSLPGLIPTGVIFGPTRREILYPRPPLPQAQGQRQGSNPSSIVSNQVKSVSIAKNKNVKVVEKYLEYVYTSNDQELKTKVASEFLRLRVNDDNCGEIVSLADLCDESILKNLTDKNVLGFYDFGEKVVSSDLMNGCFDYIKKNKKTLWKDSAALVEACKERPNLIYKLFQSS